MVLGSRHFGTTVNKTVRTRKMNSMSVKKKLIELDLYINLASGAN